MIYIICLLPCSSAACKALLRVRVIFNSVPYCHQWIGDANAAVYSGLGLSQKKRRKSCHCNNMDGAQGHYAKWNESDRGRQTVYDTSNVWNLKKTELIEIESRLVAGVGVGEMSKGG